MAKYVYPAIFREEGGRYYVRVPDLQGCITDGDTLTEAVEMARDAVEMWLCIAEDRKEDIPEPNLKLTTDSGIVSLVYADTLEYRRQNDNKAVKKTLSIPSWLNSLAEREGINFSATLQSALKKQLKIS